jgi:DNA helicase-2/ATP-dependent DNA helicase PcrA
VLPSAPPPFLLGCSWAHRAGVTSFAGGDACYSYFVDTLNEQQRAAVLATNGPVLISAGPGTGKTKTLTARILHLIQSGKAQPHEILALTFTKKAAQEMQQRVGQSGPMICTFHALCGSLLGGSHSYITEAERASIIKTLPRPRALSGVPVREVGLYISRAKNQANAPEGTASVVDTYNAALHERGLIDFDDLLLQTRDALQSGAIPRPDYRYILVDEFQDTNLLQYELLQLLRANDNLFVIGDPNQSIYGFRGASGDIFTKFTADFPHVAQVDLLQNYRSAAPIVAVANTIFSDAPQLQAVSGAAGHVVAAEFLNEYSEAHWVVNEIQNRIGGADLLQATHHDAKASLHDFAIIYRSRRVGRTIQKYIADSGLPYQVVGDGSPYDQTEVQQLLALLRTVAGRPCPVLGFTPGQVAVLVQPIDITGPPSDIAGQLVRTFHIKQTPELQQVLGVLVGHKELTGSMAYFDRIESEGFYDPSAECITLLTIHASKGLEFNHVFVVGAEQGVLPSAKGDTPEERRLFYVAATRAKEHLDITYAARRMNEPAKVSQFITELPQAILPRTQDPNMAADKRRLQKRQAKRAQISLF